MSKPLPEPTDFWLQLRSSLRAHSCGSTHHGVPTMLSNSLKCMVTGSENADLFGNPLSMDDVARAVIADPALFLRVPCIGRKSFELLQSWADARLGLSDSTHVQHIADALQAAQQNCSSPKG